MWDPQDTGNWWQQRPSFREPIVPPSAEPCDAPLVCISISQAWIPYVLGALTQLAQPSTWKVESESDRQEVLGRVQDLIALFGELMPCTSPAPAIVGIGTSQQACNIAGYLANVIIKTSIQKAIDGINDGTTILGYGVLIIGAIPGAGAIMNTLAQGLYRLYQTVEGGTLTDYQDAIADETLWSKMTCAIFTATSDDGGVTDGNFAAVQSAIAAVSYAHSDVIDAINQYVSDLGASGLEQLQSTGALAVYDCSMCGAGISTGPSSLPAHQEAGVVSVTIAAGDGSGTIAVTFPQPFAIAPVVTPNCADGTLIASVSEVTEVGMNVTIAAAVDVDSDKTADVSWIAVLPGVS